MDWKKIGKKLMFPPGWVMVMLTVISAAVLIAVFINGWEQTVIAYGAYPLSAYALGRCPAFNCRNRSGFRIYGNHAFPGRL